MYTVSGIPELTLQTTILFDAYLHKISRNGVSNEMERLAKDCQ